MNDEFILKTTDQEIINLLSAYDENKRQIVSLKALRIGLIALKDMESAGNVDYVEKEFQKFKGELNKEFSSLKGEFAKKLEETDVLIKEKLEKNFDPQTGIMPKVLERYLGDGGSLAELFDEKQNTSAISKIKKIFSEYFDGEASTVVRLLDTNNPNSPLSSFKKDILDRLFAIEKEICAKDSAKEAAKSEADRGTQKGIEYQDFVFSEVEKIACILGDTCLPTGNETGQVLDSKVGDIVVTLNQTQTGGATLKLVFEAKDKMMYITSLLKELEEAKKNRGSGYAVAVISRKDMLKDVGESIGNFRDYHSNRTICVLEKEDFDPIALEIAYKLARTKLLLGQQVREMKSESLDIDSINILIEDITKKFGDFITIKSTLTKASNAIGIAQTQIDNIKSDLVGMLEELSEKVKPVKK